jgi:hypothetical protein
MLRNAFALAWLASAATALSCMDDNGHPVDWFAFIKVNSSFSYAYMDANDPSFSQSSFKASSATSGALAHTLGPLYTGSDTSHLFYNDEKPNGSTSSSRAHAKGEKCGQHQLAMWRLAPFDRYGASFSRFMDMGSVSSVGFVVNIAVRAPEMIIPTLWLVRRRGSWSRRESRRFLARALHTPHP